MFKQSSSFEDELFRSMEKNLATHQEHANGINKLAKAVDLLGNAAAIFEQAGMSQEAELVTEVLHNLVKDLK
jgi:hypothetical protein